MSKKRRQYSAEFKAKIAIAAIRGEKTASELASQYEINGTDIRKEKGV
ncbi:MAG: transposase [Chloroflexota bacterium]